MTITIYYLNGNDAHTQYHYLDKNYRDDIVVEIDGLFYDVYFFTVDDLKYEMSGRDFCAFPGMIILEDITDDMIIKSINSLADLGYFNDLTGRTEISYDKRFRKKWYINDIGNCKPENTTIHKIRY